MPVAGRRLTILCSLMSIACLRYSGLALDASTTAGTTNIHHRRAHDRRQLTPFPVASKDEPSSPIEPALSRQRRAVRSRTVHPGPVELGRVIADETPQRSVRYPHARSPGENEVASNGMVALRKNNVDFGMVEDDEAALALLEFCMSLSTNHPSLRSR